MSFTVSQLVSDASRRISPANPSDSRDILGATGDAARRLLADITPKDLSRRVELENALYDQVYRFTCPEDLDSKNIMQWYRLSKDHNTDTFFHPMRQVTNRRFDQDKPWNRDMFTIEYQSGIKFIKVSNFNGNTPGMTIHKMESITENGTWNVFGNVVNLTTDNLTYVAGNGSLRMDINTSSNTGGIDNFTLTPVDITEYFTVGKVFTWVYVPNLNQIQTITLDLFSAVGDYYSITVNSPHDTNQFQLGWNLVGFPLDTRFMTTNGTPNPANINQIKITFVTNGTLLMESVRLDNLVLRKGAVYGIQYASDYMFHDAQTGIWKAIPTDPSDIIHVDDEIYNVLVSQLAVVIGQELFTGKSAADDIGRLEKWLDRDTKEYKKRNKEEFIEEQQQFYNFGVPFGYYNRGDDYYGRGNRDQ